MEGKYLIVDKALLPSYCEKVALAKELLDEGKAADVSEAVKMVGISRSTFYKYRDMVRDISTVKHSLDGPSRHHFHDDESQSRYPFFCTEHHLALRIQCMDHNSESSRRLQGKRGHHA